MTHGVLPRAKSAVEFASRRPRWVRAAIAIGEALLVAGCLFVFLQGWARDFSVPISFSSDSLLAEMQSKSTIDNGWWWFNPKIGAPFGLDELQFPANANVDQAIVWMISRVVREPVTAINLAWLTMVVLSGLTATWCLRHLGASTPSAIAAGVLFALTPYALYRNLDHFWMVIYLVPFVCTAGLLLATGRPKRWYWGTPHFFLVAGCALLGFNYVYYAFFGSFILIVASAIGFLQYRDPRLLAAGFVCLALIGGATVLNLAPSLYSWSQHGKPLILRDKMPAESEVYGLKIRQLVSPLFQHGFSPFRAWLAKEEAAAFPLETENRTSRLGVVATLGFLGLLALLFVPRASSGIREGEALLAASRLTLAALLLATIGGFGSLVSLLITPEIRAYNRISPFIVFFSLAAVALVFDSLCRTRPRRIAAAVAVAMVGLADQRAAAAPLNASHAVIAAEVSDLRSFVRGLEAKLPRDAMVFQLPLRTYLNDDGIARMQPYDQIKLYLMSRTVRWSYPAVTNRQVRWQQAAGTLDPARLARELAVEGFAAILVDRYGYTDNGASVVADIEGPANQQALGQTSRYIALDIRQLASAAPGTSLLAKAATPSPATVGMAACEGQPLINIDRIGRATAPFGAPPHVDRFDEFKVAGWAVDQQAGSRAAGVDVVVDQVPYQTIYGTDRGDVAAYFKRSDYLQTGFVVAIPGDKVAKGSHVLMLRVVAADAHCYYESSAQTVIID
jgi:phosphoglycerol transferase